MEPTVTPKPKKYTLYTAEAVLMRSELALFGSRGEAEILGAMAIYNYTDAMLVGQQRNHERVRAIIVSVQQARAAQVDATQEVTDAFTAARLVCSDLATVAREVLKGDKAALASLGLSRGSQPKALATFLLYADKLFDGALTAPQSVQDRLAERGYTAARLTQEKQKIAALRAANQAQEKAKGVSQDLTPQQNTLLAELDNWTMTYRKLARRALRQRPQLLEKIGVKA
jgi:hypothetical protein